MKKVLRNIFLALLLIPISLGLFGCKKDDDTTPADPKPAPPPELSVVIDTLDDIIDLSNLSTTINGSANANYLKTTNNEIITNKSYTADNFVLKADGSDFYLNIAGDSEHYLSNNILYSRDFDGSSYDKWDITYNNVMHNVLANDNGLNNIQKFIKPIALGLIENVEMFNSNWVTTRNLSNGGYGLDINVSLTSMLNKIQSIINETYSNTSENKTLEAVFNKIIAEKYPNITLEEIIVDLFGDDYNRTGFVRENTRIRTVLTHLDEKFGLDTYTIVSNMLNTYYLLTSSTGTVLSARIATDVIMETTVYSAVATIKNFVFDTDELVSNLTESQVREFVDDIVDKYFRSETYTVEYLCDKINPTINKLLNKEIDLYNILTTYNIENVAFNVKIETTADKQHLAVMSGNMDIKLNKIVVENKKTNTSNYSLTGNFALTFSGHGTTTVTPPVVAEDEYKKINIWLVVRNLNENTSYREVLEIPYFTENVEIEKGDHIFRYDTDTKKVYISPIAVNYLLGIIDYEKVDNPDRTMSFNSTLASGIEVSVKILYMPSII